MTHVRRSIFRLAGNTLRTEAFRAVSLGNLIKDLQSGYVEPRNPGSARQKSGALLTKHHAQIIRNEKVAPLTDVRISVTVRPTNRADPCDQ